MWGAEAVLLPLEGVGAKGAEGEGKFAALFCQEVERIEEEREEGRWFEGLSISIKEIRRFKCPLTTSK